MAAGLLRAGTASLPLPPTVDSAGMVEAGLPAERHAVKAVARYGVDIRDHRSKVITEPWLRDASLLIGMELRHVREVVRLDPDLFERTYTLPELARAGAVVPRSPGEGLAEWAARAEVLRTIDDLETPRPDLEVPDPMGRSMRAFRRSAALIAECIDLLVSSAWPMDHVPRAASVAPPPTGGPHADRDRR